MTDTIKDRPLAKRKLTDIDFNTEGAHIALVSEDQGHGANGHHYSLVMKASKLSPEVLEKASQVKVTMEITEFLRRMFDMYWDDAELLARALGYTTEQQDSENKASVEDYQDYITSQVQNIEVLKSLHESPDANLALCNLDEEEYLAFFQDQLTLEKALIEVDEPISKQKDSSVAKTEDTPSEGIVDKTTEITEGVNSSVIKSNKEEKEMTDKVDKTQFEELKKAHEDQAVALQKALETVAQFEAEKKEQIAKARKEALVKACSDNKDHAEAIFKAVEGADDESFNAVVAVLADIQKAVEASDLFVEKGVSAPEEEVSEVSGVEKLIKAKLASQNK